MIIIGHRGAKGLAPENTLTAIKKGIAAGADAVEFDLRLTKDKQLILLHDPSLLRTTGTRLQVRDLTLGEIKKIATKSGEPVATLEEALEITRSVPIVIEGKGDDWARPLMRALKNYEGKIFAVISKNHEELYKFSCRRPDLPTMAITLTDPFEPLNAAKKFGFTGIDMNFWLMNPIVYFMARRSRLKIVIYTINSPFLLRLVRLLYPKISAITTDYPNLFKRLK